MAPDAGPLSQDSTMHRIDCGHLPATSGRVGCFLLNGEGEADGLILTKPRIMRKAEQNGLEFKGIVDVVKGWLVGSEGNGVGLWPEIGILNIWLAPKRRRRTW